MHKEINCISKQNQGEGSGNGCLTQGKSVPFFKDKIFFDTLQNKVCPQLVKELDINVPLKVWVPGCSSGEEVYTLSIIFSEVLLFLNSIRKIHFIGTDKSMANIVKARQNIFPKKSLHNVAEPVLLRYFDEENFKFKVKPFLRRKCIFGFHDIMRNLPISRNHLIDLTNLSFFIYDTQLHIPLLEKMYSYLEPGGILLLHKWKVPENFSDFFETVDDKLFIYRKIEKPKSLPIEPSGSVNKIKPSQYSSNVNLNLDYEKQSSYIFHRNESESDALVEELTVLNEQLLSAHEEVFKEKEIACRIKDDLKAILDTVDLSLIVLDKNFRIEHYNATAGSLFNILAVDVGRNIVDLQPNIYIKNLDIVLQKVAMGKRVYEEEVCDKEGFFYLLKIKPIFNTAKILDKIIIVCTDINKIKQAHKKLHFHSEILSHIKEAVIVIDSDQRIVFFNSEAERRYEIKAADALGKKIFDIYCVKFSSLEDKITAQKDLLKYGEWKGENIHITKDGHCLFIKSIITVIKDENGECAGVQMLLQDITKRRLLEDALRKSESFNKKVLMDSLNGIYIFDIKEMLYKFVNPQYCRLTRYTAEFIYSFDGKGFLFRIHPDDRSAVLAHLKLLGKSNDGEIHEIECRFQRADGKWIWCFSRDSVFERDSDGSVRRIIGTFFDVTKRKKAEEVLKRDESKLKKFIKEQSNNLLHTKGELDKAKSLSEIGMFTATVAHELRNPLAAISMATYNIRNKSRIPQIRKNLTTIERKLYESQQIISNLLSYSHIRPPHFTKIRIFNIIQDYLKYLSEDRCKNIVVENNIGSIENIIISADPVQITEVFTNILNNAFDAVFAKAGKIKITSGLDNESVTILIQDNGVGITKGDLKKIFTPFFTTKIRGTGLGLSVCQKILELHNGSIFVESEIGRGTIVKVTLPRKKIANKYLVKTTACSDSEVM